MPYPKSIFIADDDCDDQLFLELALKEVYPECELNVSFDGEVLLDKLQSNLPLLPDLIILDINMPRVNGFEALISIRKDPAFKNVPIIMYSTSSNADCRRKALENGASHYVIKPPMLETLQHDMKKIFEGAVPIQDLA